jgi:hypothetical protein
MIDVRIEGRVGNLVLSFFLSCAYDNNNHDERDVAGWRGPT